MSAAIRNSSRPGLRGTASEGAPPPVPTIGETLGAAFRAAGDVVPFYQPDTLQDAYDPLIDEAAKATGKTRDAYKTDNWLRWDPLHPYDYAKVFPDLPEAVRQRLGLTTREEFEQRTLSRGAAGAADRDVAARGPAGARFAGGMAGAMTDPANFLTLPVGGVGRAASMRIVTEGLSQSGLTLLQTPENIAARAAAGQDTTAGDIALEVAFAGFGGAVFKTAQIGAAPAFRAAKPLVEANLAKLPAKLRERWAARETLSEPEQDVLVADVAEAVQGKDSMSPEELAATAGLRRNGEIDASSPFVADGAGAAAHGARLAAATARLIDPGEARLAQPRPRPAGAVRAREPARLDAAVLGGLKARGFPEHIARGVAAGVHAEAGANPRAVNPTSGAYGIGQWLGPRLAELRKRYGARPTIEQQLDFLAWELRGGDFGGKAVLRQGDEIAVLDAYIRKFMRPAAGAETSGDLSRGMAALGRRGERSPDEGQGEGGGAGVADEALAALDAEDARLAASRADIDRDESALLAGRALRQAQGERVEELAPPPVLRREMFPDEPSWRAAQDAVDDEHYGVLAPLRRAPARRGPEDMLRFVSRRGGLSYDGLNDLSRGIVDAPRGHDLRNTGSLATFVPGAGPLLRPGGSSLDDMAGELWDAGYFGPPSTTPRPTDTDLIGALDDAIRTKVKRYSSFDDAPEARAAKPGDADFEPPDPADAVRVENERRAYWDAAAARAGTGPLFPNEIAAVEAIMARGTDTLAPLAGEPRPSPDALAPYLLEMVNREIDDVLDAGHLETGNPRYDPYSDDFGESGEAGADFGDGRRPTAERGDADARGAGAGAGAGADPEGLSPAAALREAAMAEPVAARFDDPAGSEAAAQADGFEHDIRAALDRGALEGLTFDTGDGAMESAAVLLAKLDDDTAALEAVRACL